MLMDGCKINPKQTSSSQTNTVKETSNSSKGNSKWLELIRRSLSANFFLSSLMCSPQLGSLGIRHLGGWDTRDHDVFLRVWTQTLPPPTDTQALAGLPAKSMQSFCRRVAPLLPGKDSLEIEEHIKWYFPVTTSLLNTMTCVGTWRFNSF